MPNEPKSFPSVIPRSSTVFTHSVCFSRFCVLLGSKGPERTERLALETSEKSIERGNNGIKGRLCTNLTVWYQEGCFSNRCFEITTICSYWTSSHGVKSLMCVCVSVLWTLTRETRPASAQKGSRPDPKCSCLNVVCGQALARTDWIQLDCF